MNFKGLKVIDLSRVLAGPFCGQMLADMGADVIKVESPQGDENRKWPPILPGGQSCNFESVNRGKRSITLNLKTEEAQQVLERLVAEADVLLHSFLPNTAKRLGLEYSRMREINPRLVFCSISGYGEKGPLANKPGYDLMVQAFSGAMSTTGYEGGLPTRIGVSFIDMSTGLLAYGAITTALLKRVSSSKGAHVRVSLLETAVSLLGYHGISWLQAGVLPKKQGSGGVYQVPYQAFECEDGYVLAGAPNERAWSKMCSAVGVPELAEDPRFQSNVKRVEQRDTLIPILSGLFAQKRVGEWVDILEKAGVAVAPIHTIDQVLEHSQVKANDLVVSVKTPDGKERQVLGLPFKIDDQTLPATTAAPALGSHTEQILGSLGYSANEIIQLREAGVL